MTKSILSTLNLVKIPKRSTDPLVQRQNKLIKHVEVQREMARCLIENEIFTAYKEVYKVDEQQALNKR